MSSQFFAVMRNPKNGDYVTFETARGYLRKWGSVGACRRFLSKDPRACAWGATIHDYDGYTARFNPPDTSGPT